MKHLLLLTLSILLSGCLLETVGPIDRNIKPYGAHWVKEGMTQEQRRTDSWACGTANTAHAADHVVFSKEQQKQEMRSDESDDSLANIRLTKAWIKCMAAKDYRYQAQ
jgi:hypothetical protein